MGVGVWGGGGCMHVCVWGMRKQTNRRACQNTRSFSHRCVRPKKSIFVMLSEPFLLPDGPLLLTNAITNARDICVGGWVGRVRGEGCMRACVWGMRKQKNRRVCQNTRPFSHRCVRPKKSIFVMLSCQMVPSS